MESFIENTKKALKDIPPVYIVGALAFVIYLLETHPILAGFVVFGFLITFIFKKWGVIILSILADFADYMGAAVPIVGDFLDIFIVIIQAARYGTQGFVGLFELIPFADLFPILAINAAFAEHKKKNNPATT